MPIHKASDTDTLQSIAREHGYLWQTLWDLEENRALRDERKDPNCLQAGDEVFVPERREKQEDAAGEQHHRFRRKGLPSRVKVRLLVEGEPDHYAGKKWVLDLDGRLHDGTVADDGTVELPVPPEARKAELHVGEGDEEEVVTLTLGALDPVGTPRGAQQRLRNLGFLASDPATEWTEEALAALETFQKAHVVKEGEAPSGEYDAATRDKLEEIHESGSG